MPAGTAAFWMLSLMLALTPGADWAYAISAGLRFRTVEPAVGGLLLVEQLVKCGVWHKFRDGIRARTQMNGVQLF